MINLKYSTGNKPIALILIFLFIILTICLVILAAVPPVSRDALIHHLAIPKLYLSHGGIYEIPDLIFSYYPMNLDLLYMGALYLGNDILPKYIHMAFGFGTAFLIFKYLSENLTRLYAYLGAVFFLSIPIIVKLSITVYVDLGLTFFSTASILLLFRWRNAHFKVINLFLAALFCGLALGTKYNGLLVLLLLSSFVSLIFTRSSHISINKPGKAIQFSFVFIVVSLLLSSPLFIRNYGWTGNPIFPLYNGFFSALSSGNQSVVDSNQNVQGIFNLRQALYGENFLSTLMIPVRIFFEGIDNNPRYFDGRLTPFLLLLPLFAFRSSLSKNSSQSDKLYLLLFVCLYFLFSFHTNVIRVRYLAPIIPLLVILSMYGLKNITESLSNKFRNKNYHQYVWYILVTIMLGYNSIYIYQQFQIVEPIKYISKKTDRTDYLQEKLPEYKSVLFANKNLPASSKILCVFLGWRGYYFEHPLVFDHHSNHKWLVNWMEKPDMTTGEFAVYLNKNGITHLLIREDIFLSWSEKIDIRGKLAWNGLYRNNLKLLFSANHFSLFELRSGPVF